VVTTDSLVEGIHWDHRLSPADVGWKSIAVSVSDLAAMGAKPQWATCSVALPNHDSLWVQSFATGMQEASRAFGVALIGGDTCASPGPRFINITMGGLAVASPICRTGASPDDDLWVTGIPGLAAAGYVLDDPFDSALEALRRPRPPLSFALAMAKQGIVSAMMDLSGGVRSDLPRLCSASAVGATVYNDNFPTESTLDGVSELPALRFAGGDDYQLLFTAPPVARKQTVALAKQHGILLSRIGEITIDLSVKVASIPWPAPPWSHFQSDRR